MQDYREIKRVERYGQIEDECEEDETLFSAEENPPRRYSLIPLMQVAACALILLGLFYLKTFEPQRYTEVTAWYQQQIGEEVELPSLVESTQESVPEASSEGAGIPSAFREKNKGYSISC